MSAQESATRARTPDVPFVPTPQPVVEAMLKLADVKKGDVLYDLGSGDGRLVVTAAKLYGVKGTGIDIDPQRIQEANANAKKEGVENLVRFLNQDLFEADIHDATCRDALSASRDQSEAEAKALEGPEARYENRVAQLRHGRLAA